jgi:hypothetical protein
MWPILQTRTNSTNNLKKTCRHGSMPAVRTSGKRVTRVPREFVRNEWQFYQTTKARCTCDETVLLSSIFQPLCVARPSCPEAPVPGDVGLPLDEDERISCGFLPRSLGTAAEDQYRERIGYLMCMTVNN